MSKHQDSKPVEIKISTVVAVSVILHTVDPAVLDSAMQSMTAGVEDYFDREFAVLDVAHCDVGADTDWHALVALFKSYGLNPVAVRGAPAMLEAAILASGLSIDTLATPRSEPAQAPAEPARTVETAQAPATAAAPSAPVSTMFIDAPVRAGQRIYARGADLVVTAVVNSGAELIADGSIHVYAPLRGRALAGASGNAEARIFTLSMEAELVSIAGIYRMFESGLPKEVAKKAAQVRLAGDRLDVLSVSA
jgi:septum site-determining protein MinC